jgi:hypothetical protein
MMYKLKNSYTETSNEAAHQRAARISLIFTPKKRQFHIPRPRARTAHMERYSTAPPISVSESESGGVEKSKVQEETFDSSDEPRERDSKEGGDNGKESVDEDASCGESVAEEGIMRGEEKGSSLSSGEATRSTTRLLD